MAGVRVACRKESQARLLTLQWKAFNKGQRCAVAPPPTVWWPKRLSSSHFAQLLERGIQLALQLDGVRCFLRRHALHGAKQPKGAKSVQSPGVEM